MEKNMEKEYTHTHTQVNHFAVHLKLTQNVKATRVHFKIRIAICAI